MYCIMLNIAMMPWKLLNELITGFVSLERYELKDFDDHIFRHKFRSSKKEKHELDMCLIKQQRFAYDGVADTPSVVLVLCVMGLQV